MQLANSLTIQKKEKKLIVKPKYCQIVGNNPIQWIVCEEEQIFLFGQILLFEKDNSSFIAIQFNELCVDDDKKWSDFWEG